MMKGAHSVQVTAILRESNQTEYPWLKSTVTWTRANATSYTRL